MNSLPIELVRKILNIAAPLYDDEGDSTRRCLKACSLTCHQWNTITSPAIMRHPQIRNEHSAIALMCLPQERLLQVRELHFYRQIQSDLACRILSKCLNIETLRLTWYLSPDDFDNIRQAAAHILKLKHLHLHRCYFLCNPISILKLFESVLDLETISIEGSDVNFQYLVNGTESVPDIDGKLTQKPATVTFNRVHTLRMTGTSSMTDSFLTALTRGLPRIRSLDLSQCCSTTDWSVPELLTYHIVSLDITGTLVTDTTLHAIADVCTSLQLLTVGTSLNPHRSQKMLEITDASVSQITTHCKSLQHLSLHGCTKLTDESFLPLLSANSQLVHLDIGMTQVTTRFFRLLNDKLNKLEYLDVAACPRLELAVDRGGKRTVPGPVESFVISSSKLVYVSCDFLENIKTRYLYGFRSVPSKVSTKILIGDLAEFCTLTEKELSRVRKHSMQ